MVPPGLDAPPMAVDHCFDRSGRGAVSQDLADLGVAEAVDGEPYGQPLPKVLDCG
jgi:hypothetical protein